MKSPAVRVTWPASSISLSGGEAAGGVELHDGVVALDEEADLALAGERLSSR